MVGVFQPYVFEVFDDEGAPQQIERGLTTFGDLRYYYEFAVISADGQLPYRDYWFEFPPVWYALFTGVYHFVEAFGRVDFSGWAKAVGLIMLLFDLGNLALIRRLGTRLHGELTAIALCWIYVLLAAPAIFPWWTFETIVVFLMLSSLTWLMEGHDSASASLTALGTLTKYTPILVLPTVWRFYPRRRAIRYSVLTLALVGLVLGGLLFWGGNFARASLLAQFNKASYQTVWALIDGNHITGSFPGVVSRFDADTAYDLRGSAPVVPSLLRMIPFALLGLFFYTRPMRKDDRGVLAFFTVTVVIFFLWSQGWSPQWTLTLAPLILLNFPTRDGVLACLVIGFTSFVEYPVLFMQAGETGEISGNLMLPFITMILIRTGILSGLVVALYQRLTRGVVREGTH